VAIPSSPVNVMKSGIIVFFIYTSVNISMKIPHMFISFWRLGDYSFSRYHRAIVETTLSPYVFVAITTLFCHESYKIYFVKSRGCKNNYISTYLGFNKLQLFQVT